MIASASRQLFAATTLRGAVVRGQSDSCRKIVVRLLVIVTVMTFSFIGGFGAIAGAGTEKSPPEIRAVRCAFEPPKIDGDLNDSLWNRARSAAVRGFTQREPDDGAAATESTVVAVAYGDHAIYVAFWCYDSEPDKIDRQLVRRDRYSESDYVVVRLDPYHDHQTGNQFYLSAAGVQIDGRIFNDDWIDDSWDAVWDGAAKIHSWGWAAEYRIPYHCLRFTDQDENTWGVNFSREVNRKEEASRWSYSPVTEKGLTSRYGHLTALAGIKPARQLELLPYAVSKAEITDKTKGNPDGRDFLNNTGIDVKYGLSSNLTLNATVNPDFGQVELDEPVLNLSEFETWFPERRPFFIEGADLFNTDYSLFYSRRIGGAPREGIDDNDYDYTLDSPNATSILGAAKLTGKLSGGTSLAALTAVTEQEEEVYRTVTGDTRSAIIEPTANYSVLRLKQDVLGNSSVGGLLTLATQNTYHPAVTGGIDWRLHTTSNTWLLRGQSVFSRVDNEDVGFGLSAVIQKESGAHTRGALGINIKGPNLRINRLGFTNRNDWREVQTWWQYRTQDDWWIIRNSWNNINAWQAWNYGGYSISRGGNVNTYIEFTNYWSLSGGVSVQAERFNDLETRGNGIWEWPVHPTFFWWADLQTDVRRPISVNINPRSGTDRGGSWWATYLSIKCRPRSNLEFQSGVNYHRTFNATRWVENVDHDEDEDTPDLAVFADLDKDEVSLELTVSMMLRRTLSIQLSGQGLISALRYQDYRRYLGGNDYARDVDPLDKDRIFSSLNSMLLMRWEYLPGSTLYFVWTRVRDESDESRHNLVMREELDRFFSRGAENLYLVKVSHWLNI